MKLTIKNDPDKKATFDPKEYFPFRAVLSDKAAELAHIGFYYKDSNLFELTIDRSTGSIIEMVLTICNRFQINKKKLMLPDMANSDMISLEINESVRCSSFLTEIYKDGIFIKFSEARPVTKAGYGNIAYFFDSEKNLTGIAATNMSSGEIGHCITELQNMK